MNEEQYVIGIDVGTSSAKGFLFDQEGKVEADSHFQYKIMSPNPGWKEQKAEWWWNAVKRIGNDLANKVTLSRENLNGVGITHQRMTFVPVNQRMEPIHNAILWNDTRCGAEVKEVTQELGREEVFKETGAAPGLWTVYKILWLKKNKPKIYEKAYKFLLVPDFLTYKLTANLLTTQSAAVLTGALDISHPKRWNSSFLKTLDIREDLLVPKICSSGTKAGEVTEQASNETSIPEGTPIITAAGDQPCGSLGSGLMEEKKAAINGGTSCTCEVLVRNLPDEEKPNYFVEISPTGDYLLETSVYSGGSALINWYRNNFGTREVQKAEEKNENVWSYIYKKAEEAPPGNLGMLLVPYFDGAGPPYWDMDAKGILLGLTLDHKSPHMIRAIMEGLAFEVKRDIALLEGAMDGKVKEAVMYGGSSKSEVWNQMFSDILGVKLSVPETSETTALGAAICAAAGSGMYSSIGKAAKEMVRKKAEYRPRKKEEEMYSKLYDEAYEKIYERVSDLMRKAEEITHTRR